MNTAVPAMHSRHHAPRDYASTPLNVYWEMTQSCALACRHCRAEAMLAAHPGQLSTAEGKALLRQVADFGEPRPQVILTGGDPLQRPDLFELIDEAVRLGVSVSITPAATPRLTYHVLEQLRQHGVAGLGLSLDGAAAERHDAIRGIDGCFERTILAARWAAELGIPLQVNTLVAAETAADLPAVFELLKGLRVARWSLFFLISVGRGRVLEALSPEQGEALMRWVYATSRVAPFAVATTEAPSYRRVALELMRAEGLSPAEIKQTPAYRGFGIRDGHGIVFVSHTGDICPAGFLPLAAGNVRHDSLPEMYRSAPLFASLHQPSGFTGKCGSCDHRVICGGSRSRAFAASGDPLAEDPFCPYQPGKNEHVPSAGARAAAPHPLA
ncbi:TIGR04053 family radical SAM/SPASM domain-containing protein [Kouleothrix sp.]|uniref:TIGR04053 family radical SAM/SPASM domain-containing protein n=1 Tax=Kouleothrix sp. TaxID=2779161 RepID=UPI00391AE104